MIKTQYERLKECHDSDYKHLDLNCCKIPQIPNFMRYPKLSKIKYLFIHTNRLTNLDGLEFFTNLEVLDISSNKLTNLDALPNTLEELVCFNNPLTKMPNLPNLRRIICRDCKLDYIPYYPLLTDIDCSNNRISKIKLCNNLDRFICANNKLQYVNLTPNIRILDLENNLIDNSILNINMPNLEELILNNTNISSIDPRKYPKLIVLEIYNTKIRRLHYIDTLINLVTSTDSISLSSKFNTNEVRIVDHKTYTSFHVGEYDS